MASVFERRRAGRAGVPEHPVLKGLGRLGSGGGGGLDEAIKGGDDDDERWETRESEEGVTAMNGSRRAKGVG